MTAYYTPEIVKLVVKGMSQELKPETLQKEPRGSPQCGCPASETSQLYDRMTTCTDSKQVFPRPTPYMLQMAQVPVMNDSGAK